MKKLLLLLVTFLSFTAISQTVTLTGSGTDTDGTIIAYQWRKVSGPATGIITSPNAAVTTVTGLTSGIYLFELTVTDNAGATGTDTVQITVLAGNVKPKSNAGADQIITLPSTSTILRGSAISETGKITAYKWTKIGTGNPGIIVSSTSARTYVVNMYKIGSYPFVLKVTNSNGYTDVDTMKVVVYPKRT